MSKKESINVQGTEIVLFSHKKEDYISLTDMAKYKNAEATGLVISHWLSTRYTIDFLGIWERVNNPDFNVTEFSNIKSEAGANGFVLTSKQWIEKTNAIGIIAKPGRYGGGTFAHRDIAFEFASWLSAELRDQNPATKGNILDAATLEQLVVLSNMESINALLIRQELPQSRRLVELNKVAITQMKSLVDNQNLNRLKE
jgi:hypothetical protein